MGRFVPWFVFSVLVSPTQLLAEPLTEAQATLRVCRSGTEALVASAKRLQGDAAEKAANVLPNPAMFVEHQRSLSGPSDRETTVGLSVPLGIGGRRGLLLDAARERKRQASAEARSGLLTAAIDFREAYGRAVLERARMAVLTENQTTLDALTGVITKLQRGGETAGYDGLRQQAQARIHRQQTQAAAARATAAQAALQAWVEAEVAFRETARTESDSPMDRAADAPPLVAALRSEATAAELEARAARRRAVPDLLVFGGYRAVTAGGATGHGVALSLELPLTLFDHGQGEAARASAEADLARALAQRLERRNATMTRAGMAQLAQLQAIESESEDGVRDALATREKALQLYAAGETSITDVLDAFRTAEAAQLARLDLAEEILRTRIALMRLAGTLFNATLDHECRDAGRAP